MKDFSIIYALSRLPVFSATHIFYTVKVWHPKNLPFSGPVLICSNHANAFMDPALVASEMWRQIYSLARGDAFKGKFVSWLLKQYKINPIYRLSEGIENLHKNEQTFARSYEILERKNALIMYPEGICIQEKRLKKLKKGAGRIALGVEEKNGFNLNLTILPVVLNYSNAKKFGSTLFINFGEPFKVTNFKELYEKDKVRAINEFTQYLEAEMTKLMVIVENKDNDELFEQILVLCKDEVIDKHQWDRKNLQHDHMASMLIAKKMNYLSKHDPEKTKEIKVVLSSYFDKLEHYKLRDHLLKNKVVNNAGLFNAVLDVLVLFLGAPLHIMGLLCNYLPYRVAYKTADKVAKTVEFHASVNIASGMVLWIFYYFLQLFIVGKLFHSWSILLTVALLIPLTGVYSISFYKMMKKVMGKWRLKRLFKDDSSSYSELLQARERTMKELQALRLNE